MSPPTPAAVKTVATQPPGAVRGAQGCRHLVVLRYRAWARKAWLRCGSSTLADRSGSIERRGRQRRDTRSLRIRGASSSRRSLAFLEDPSWASRLHSRPKMGSRSPRSRTRRTCCIVLPEAGDPKYQCLSRVDWYGDTIFNYLQAPRLLLEWQTLESAKRDPETERVLEGIRKLAERLREERHVYLKFYGD